MIGVCPSLRKSGRITANPRAFHSIFVVDMNAEATWPTDGAPLLPLAEDLLLDGRVAICLQPGLVIIHMKHSHCNIGALRPSPTMAPHSNGLSGRCCRGWLGLSCNWSQAR